MANVDRPNGFRPFEKVMRQSIYVAGGTIYPGDAVKLDSGKVVVASAGDSLLGVAAGYAEADKEVKVYDDPEQKFVIQADDGTNMAISDVGKNYDIVATSGNSTYRQSRMELDSDSGDAEDGSLPLKLLGYSREVGEELGEHAKCVVTINNHLLGKLMPPEEAQA